MNSTYEEKQTITVLSNEPAPDGFNNQCNTRLVEYLKWKPQPQVYTLSCFVSLYGYKDYRTQQCLSPIKGFRCVLQSSLVPKNSVFQNDINHIFLLECMIFSLVVWGSFAQGLSDPRFLPLLQCRVQWNCCDTSRIYIYIYIHTCSKKAPLS